MARYNQKYSLYSDYVIGQVGKLRRAGGGSYTVKELAEFMGLKLTGNFRKRLRTLERDGYITVSYGQAGKCGTCLVYTISPKNTRKLDLSDIPL